jgi:outer membrane protein OmpA-like peptidoglycan-associated protein
MWRMFAAAALIAMCAQSAFAQEEFGGHIVDLVFKVVDLRFQVEDLGGKTQVIAGKVEALQVKETATETRIELPADILFDFDKYDIRPGAAAALKQAADILRERAKGAVRIEGHTDSKGVHSYNQTLSDRRAVSVQKWLIGHEGLKKMKFVALGFAETRPVAPNTKPDGSDDSDGRQKNRRVEIVFGKQ